MKTNLTIGIDLGTTNTVVSVLDNNKPTTLLIDGNKLLPSAVYYSNDTFTVGQSAKNIAILEPENTVLSIKRKMGQDIIIQLGSMKFKPEEISSFILKKVKNAVLDFLELKEQIVDAVVTVPAYFTETQREATKLSAEMAGLNVLRIINEPTAAALAFGLNKVDDKKFIIYDFGGGTFDISVIENNSGIIEVRSTTGDNMLGGDDIDKLLADFIWLQFLEKYNVKIERTKKINSRLIKIAEETKIQLSTEKEVEIKENFFAKQDDKPLHLELTISRIDFDRLIKDIVLKTTDLINQAVDSANLFYNDIEGIILVGGSSRIPLVQATIEEVTGIVPSLIDLPDEAVSHGATIQGAIINGIDVDTILVDITPHSLGVKVLDFFSRMNDEERFFVEFLIDKNTPVPVRKSKNFSAASSFQTGYEIEVYQGESHFPNDNKKIGDCMLEVKNPVEHGELEVIFELDINGILNIKATQIGTNDKVEATFKSSKGIKIKQNNLINNIIGTDTETKNLIARAEKILERKDLNSEDKDELNSLLNKFKNEKTDNDSNMKSTEENLLDLLYYLEEN